VRAAVMASVPITSTPVLASMMTAVLLPFAAPLVSVASVFVCRDPTRFVGGGHGSDTQRSAEGRSCEDQRSDPTTKSRGKCNHGGDPQGCLERAAYGGTSLHRRCQRDTPEKTASLGNARTLEAGRRGKASRAATHCRARGRSVTRHT